MFTKVASTVKESEVAKSRQEAFKLPVDTGEAIEFVIGLKNNAPFEYYSLGGISFQKYLLPSEASLVSNGGKIYQGQRLLMKLTKLQVEAIKKEAAIRDVPLPMTRNPQYNPADRESRQFLPATKVRLSNWIICEPAATFNELNYLSEEGDKRTFKTFRDDTPTGSPDQAKEELVEAQRQNKKGK